MVAGLPSANLLRFPGLSAYGVLDAGAELALNEIARLAALSSGVPIALVSLSDRFVQLRTSNEVSCRDFHLPFCTHTIAGSARMVVVPDARRDARFAGHPLVASRPGLAFMAVAPLRGTGGDSIGTLCVADYRPGELSDAQAQMLQGLAAQAAAQLELRSNVMQLESKVASQSRYVEQLKREHRELQKQNGTDPLTGLGNRRSFHDRLCLEIGRAECTSTSAALLVFDVDHFKSYNDSFGHPAGDVVLKQLADLVLHSCRSEDFAARVGGEEFAVLLPGTARKDAFVFANWLRRRVQRESWPHRPVTISVGVAVSSPGESGLQLAARADVALYRSKRDGRNRVTLATSAP